MVQKDVKLFSLTISIFYKLLQSSVEKEENFPSIKRFTPSLSHNRNSVNIFMDVETGISIVILFFFIID